MITERITEIAFSGALLSLLAPVAESEEARQSKLLVADDERALREEFDAILAGMRAALEQARRGRGGKQ